MLTHWRCTVRTLRAVVVLLGLAVWGAVVIIEAAKGMAIGESTWAAGPALVLALLMSLRSFCQDKEDKTP